jgi:hypothetical protein
MTTTTFCSMERSEIKGRKIMEYDTKEFYLKTSKKTVSEKLPSCSFLKLKDLIAAKLKVQVTSIESLWSQQLSKNYPIEDGS